MLLPTHLPLLADFLPMLRRAFLFFLLLALVAAPTPMTLSASEDQPSAFAPETTEFLQTHCLRCHKGERAKGKLDLAQFQTPASLKEESKRWGRIIARVEAGEMPPVGSKQPEAADRDRFLTAIKPALYAVLCEAGPTPSPAPL